MRSTLGFVSVLVLTAHLGCSSSDDSGGSSPTAGASGTVTCGSGQADCFGACVDLSSDPAHCGSCVNACGVDVACVAGSCVPGAPPATGGTGGQGTGGTATGGDPATGGVPATGGGTADECASGPLATSLPNCVLTPLVSTGDYHQDCVNQINAFRWDCQCLPPLERWTEAEACADQMAQYDWEQQDYHQGFIDGICDPSGRAQCECPGWNSVESITQGTQRMDSCLQMMWSEVDDPTGEQGHYEAMSSSSHMRVACGIYVAADGEVWAVQNYTNN